MRQPTRQLDLSPRLLRLTGVVLAVLLLALPMGCRSLPTDASFGYRAGDGDGVGDLEASDAIAGPSCGNGACDGEETVLSCGQDCHAERPHVSGACTQVGTRAGCQPDEVCVARSAVAGGPACVMDLRTWPLQGTSHAVDAWLEGAQTVTDTTSGLTWTKEVLPTMKWGEAIFACSSREDGGATDWRLPTRAELISLLEFDRAETLCGAPGFKWNGGGDSLWSASTVPDSTKAWAVHFRGHEIAPELPTYPCGVRCVRGGPALPRSPKGPRFALLPDGLEVLDRQTGLRWLLEVGPEVKRTDAMAACAAIDGGRADAGWRLPTVQELVDIVDIQRIQPTADPVFGAAPLERHWTATRLEPTQELWWVDFDRGGASGIPTAAGRVRCVR